MKPRVAVIGGFLGAGKTTLILKAARVLAERGVRVAAVLNDQGDDLVDTELLRRHGIAADQVGGGCFCCRFPDLIDALDRVSADGPEVIFAEAVGSCTDLVATTLRPLLRDHGERFRIAPLTVLVHDTPNEPDLRFLFDHQVAEADVVIDRGVDVAAWIDGLLGEGVAVGTRSIAVDYARYADAEAALGWLNARVTVRRRPAVSPAMVVGPLIEELGAATSAAGIRIVFGGMLLTAAQTSRAPNLLRACGAIILIAGLATPWFGAERAREVLAAAGAADGAGMRIACTVAVALGSSFVWALSPRGAPRPR